MKVTISSYSNFLEKRKHSLLIQIEILGNACVFSSE